MATVYFFFLTEYSWNKSTKKFNTQLLIITISPLKISDIATLFFCHSEWSKESLICEIPRRSYVSLSE